MTFSKIQTCFHHYSHNEAPTNDGKLLCARFSKFGTPESTPWHMMTTIWAFFFFFFQLLFCQQMFLWDLVMRYPKDGSRVSILEPLHWRGLFWWVYFLFRARFSGWKFKRLANIFQSNYQTIVSLTWKTKPNSLYCVFSCIKNEVCNCCRFKYTYTLHILYIRFVSIY